MTLMTLRRLSSVMNDMVDRVSNPSVTLAAQITPSLQTMVLDWEIAVLGSTLSV